MRLLSEDVRPFDMPISVQRKNEFIPNRRWLLKMLAIYSIAAGIGALAFLIYGALRTQPVDTRRLVTVFGPLAVVALTAAHYLRPAALPGQAADLRKKPRLK
jgi:hypothetical protein